MAAIHKDDKVNVRLEALADVMIRKGPVKEKAASFLELSKALLDVQQGGDDRATRERIVFPIEFTPYSTELLCFGEAIFSTGAFDLAPRTKNLMPEPAFLLLITDGRFRELELRWAMIKPACKNAPKGTPWKNFHSDKDANHRDDARGLVAGVLENGLSTQIDGLARSNLCQWFEVGVNDDLYNCLKGKRPINRNRASYTQTHLIWLPLHVVDLGNRSLGWQDDLLAAMGKARTFLLEQLSRPDSKMAELYQGMGFVHANGSTTATGTTSKKTEQKKFVMPNSLNAILYGPPGTGKTYNTARYAVSICDNGRLPAKYNEREALMKRYKELRDASRVEFVTFHQSYGYEDFVEGIRPVMKDKKTKKGEVAYEVTDGVFKRICEKAKNKKENYVLIIDEINRGNISKILGELITLLEPDKRLGQPNDPLLTLPYSKEPFSVPSNLYIIGTMNTTDRSIAFLDSALRRRFKFIEMNPVYDASVIGDEDAREFLKTLNERIEFFLDRDHLIGHSYFRQVEGWRALRDVVEHDIYPLLREYFYGDGEKLGLVLGHSKDEKSIIQSSQRKFNDVFGAASNSSGYEEKVVCQLHEEFVKPETTDETLTLFFDYFHRRKPAED